MKALFIGRFQPFHKGHLNIIKKISSEYEEIIIGIGSSQYHNSNENPFTSEERKQMINSILTELGIKKYKIIEIPDIHNLPKWVEYVTSIISNFDIVITNSQLTKQLFEEKGYLVKNTPIFKRDQYSGHEIRKRIKENEEWESLVPQSIVNIIKEIDGINRIKNI